MSQKRATPTPAHIHLQKKSKYAEFKAVEFVSSQVLFCFHTNTVQQIWPC